MSEEVTPEPTEPHLSHDREHEPAAELGSQEHRELVPAPTDAHETPTAQGTEALAALRARGAQFTANAPTFLTRRYLAGALVHTGVAVATAVLAVLMTLGLLLLELAHIASANGDTASSSSDGSGFTFGKAFRLGFGWLLSLTFGGNVHATSGLSVFGASANLGATFHGAPVFLTAVVLALAIWSGIVVEKRAATGSWAWRLGVSAATGLVASAIISILAAAFGHGNTGKSGNDLFSGDLHLSAGGPGVFLTGWLLIALAAFLGRQVGHWGGWKTIAVKAPAAVRDFAVWATALGVVFGILALAAGVIYGIKQGTIIGTLLSLPLWLGQATVYAATLGHFGALNVSTGGVGSLMNMVNGDSSNLPNLDRAFTVFNVGGLVPGGGLVWVLFGFAVLTLLWAGLRIGVLRAARPSSYLDRGVFVALSLVSALLIPVLLTNIRVSASGAAQVLKTIGTSLHGGFGAAAWVFLAFGLTAILIDLVAGYVTPLLAVVFPAPVHLASIGVAASADGTAAPLSPAARKATVWTASVVGGLAVLAGVFFGVVAVLNHTVYTPEKPIAQYAGLVAAGDFKDAAKAASPGGHAAAARARTTISNVKVSAGKATGDYAQVKVTYRLNGTSHSQQVLARNDSAGLFNHWKVASPLTSSVTLSSNASDGTSADVGGETVKLNRGAVNLFPGVYRVIPHGGLYLSAPAFTVAAASQDGVSRDIEWGFTPAVEKAVQKAVDNTLDGDCLNSDASGWSCGLRSDAQEADDNSDFDTTWSNLSYPVVKLNADGSFTTATAGSAKAAWKDVSFDDNFNEVDTDNSANQDYYVYGEFSVDPSGVSLDGAEVTTEKSDLPDASDNSDS